VIQEEVRAQIGNRGASALKVEKVRIDMEGGKVLTEQASEKQMVERSLDERNGGHTMADFDTQHRRAR